MKFFKVFFNLIFGILLLGANTITISHHHKDGENHHDCQICILQLNQQTEDPSDLIFEINLPQEKNSYEEKLTQENLKVIFYKILIRGPPSFNF